MGKYFSFQWHITDACDQRCRHCYIFAGDRWKKIESMSWPDMEHVLANCLRFTDACGRTPYFYITGGDPILHPLFWKLLERLKSLGIHFTIMGNPFHLDDEACGRLAVCGCEKYQLSLDGMRETHDFIRKPGSFDCTLDRISLINRAGMTSVVMVTVSDLNFAEMSGLIDLAVRHDVGIFSFARYCPGNGELGIAPLQYRAFLESCDRKFRYYEETGCQTWFNRKDHLWTLYEYEKGLFAIPEEAKDDMIYGGCNCGNCHLTILPNGNVLACRRVRGSLVGNALVDRLSGIWINEMERYRDYKKFKKCSGCELMSWCRGCPAVASAKSGDFYDADPQCWKQTGTAFR